MRLYDAGLRAVRTFRTFDDGVPDLIRLGLPAVDAEIGGVGAGTLVVIALPTGVGKSSTALSMLRNSPQRGGLCSMEDPEDMWGARLLADVSGVSSLKIRRKDLTEADKEAIQQGLEVLRETDELGHSPVLKFLIGKSIAEVTRAVEEQAEAGCKFSILDYLQKVRGVAEDRRNEVGLVLSQFQGACYQNGMVPIVLSQFSRLSAGQRPRIHMLKESGDIENEARVIILGWQDPQHKRVIRYSLDKCNFGGAGLEWAMHYDDSGTLRDGLPDADEEEF